MNIDLVHKVGPAPDNFSLNTVINIKKSISINTYFIKGYHDVSLRLLLVGTDQVICQNQQVHNTCNTLTVLLYVVCQTLLAIPSWLTLLPLILTAVVAIAFRFVLTINIYLFICVCWLWLTCSITRKPNHM